MVAGCVVEQKWPWGVSWLKTPRPAAQVNKLFAVVVTATATLSLLTDRGTAGPPFVTDDPEPVPYQHFEFYMMLTLRPWVWA